MKIVLASASPRRLELVKQIGLEPQVIVREFAELEGANIAPKELVEANAEGKGKIVVAEIGDATPVVSADTIVVIDNNILGKPKTNEEAKKMLTKLNGNEHEVFTAVAVFYKGKTLVETVATKVEFRLLTETELDSYIALGESLDKAGGYGIQGQGAVLIEKINGSYDNVVGLPLAKLYTMLKQIGGVEDGL